MERRGGGGGKVGNSHVDSFSVCNSGYSALSYVCPSREEIEMR